VLGANSQFHGLPGLRRSGIWPPLRRLIQVLLAVILLSGSTALYLSERSAEQLAVQVGAPGKGAWLELDVTVQHVNVGDQQMVLTVLPVPHGSLAVNASALTLSRSVQVNTTSLTTSDFQIQARRTVTQQQIPVGLNDGVPSDYPFDHYTAEIGFTASEDSGSVPVVMNVYNADPSFELHPKSAAPVGDGAQLTVSFSRSRGTYILSWFMMAAMWALALSVMMGARMIVRQRAGMIWPALSWMAATLFALVSLRNAAPGSPPIGSLMDYLAFFGAEVVIAVSVTLTAAQGLWTESRAERNTSSS
jgi:hypothetical protein